MSQHKNYRQLLTVVLVTLIALLPEFVMRRNMITLYYMYEHFTTYFGDLWYCWDNYLSKGFPYPREYPALIQGIFRVLFKIPGVAEDYNYYIWFIVAILTASAVISSCYLFIIRGSWQRLLMYWLLAPSFLFYGLMNVDVLPIATIVLSYYCFSREKYNWSASWLALGTAIKVFPVFLFPVYFFATPKDKRLELASFMVVIWLALNLPFMAADWSAWSYPYLWQIQENYARTVTDGSWTWLVFTLFDHFGIGSWSGKVSLCLFAGSYLYFIRKYHHLPLARQLLIVMILFILTDRVYSPQYNLYLLPFLALVDYKIDWRWFYLLEISDLIQGFFLFAVKNNPYYLQSILVLKYIALILLLRQVLTAKQEEAVK